MNERDMKLLLDAQALKKVQVHYGVMSQGYMIVADGKPLETGKKETRELPTVNPLALISSNKKYLAKIGYLETYINGLPDWFLFHPRIAVLIRCLKDAARTNPKVIPFELKLIAFGESPRSMVLAGASNKQPRPNGSAVNQNKKTKPDGVKTPFELAFENAKKMKQ